MSKRTELLDEILNKMKAVDSEMDQEKLCELLGRSSGLRNILRKSSKPVMKTKDVAHLHMVSGLNIDRFLPSLKEENSFFGGMKKHNSWFTHSLRDTIKKFQDETDINIDVFHPGENPNQEGYDTLYLSKIEKIYRDAESSIFASEILFKGDNNNPGQCLMKYRAAHETLYRIIENKLEKDPSFTYKRIFCLSPSTSIHNKVIKAPSPYYHSKQELEKRDIEIREIENAFLIECSMEALNHVKRCLKIKSRTGNEKIIFQITPKTRFRHHCIIDDKILLTEDYTKSDIGIVPDQVIIDRLLDSDSDLANGIKTLIKNLSNGCIMITDDLVCADRLAIFTDRIEARFEARDFLLENYENMLSKLDFEKKRKYFFEISTIRNRLRFEGDTLNKQHENLLFKHTNLTK